MVLWYSRSQSQIEKKKSANVDVKVFGCASFQSPAEGKSASFLPDHTAGKTVLGVSSLDESVSLGTSSLHCYSSLDSEASDDPLDEVLLTQAQIKWHLYTANTHTFKFLSFIIQ